MHGPPLGSEATGDKRDGAVGGGGAVATARDARHPQVSEKKKKFLQPSPRCALRAAAVPGCPGPSEFELKSFLCESPPASKQHLGGNWKAEAVEGGPAETRRRSTNGKQERNNGDETQCQNLNKSRDEVC